ncbi:hypothetical protein GCM10010282_19190 [Streptomyces roseolus]|nr:hypothetical protein GCM10010282_19190 [Streptomyces roseolus]
MPLGYHDGPAKTAETFFERDGVRWVLLGGMATVDADGVVTVLGRGSQCIDTGGEKVCPEEVEQALKSHPDVYDALVAGVPDATWSSHVAAVVQQRGARTRWTWRPSRTTAAATSRATGCPAGSSSPTASSARRAARRTTAGRRRSRRRRTRPADGAVPGGRPREGPGAARYGGGPSPRC